MVEAGRAQRQQAHATGVQPPQDTGVQVVVDEGADGQRPVGGARAAVVQARLVKFELVAPARVCSLKEEAVIGAGAEDRNAHVSALSGNATWACQGPSWRKQQGARVVRCGTCGIC